MAEKPLFKDRDTLAAHVAQMHLASDRPLSQGEIARRLGLDKATVSRLMQYAREKGIVQWSIRLPREKELEVKLARRFELVDARVVPIIPPQKKQEATTFREFLGQAAANYIEEQDAFAKPGYQIGIGCGATMREFVVALRPGRFKRVRLSQLTIETDTDCFIDEAPFTLVGMVYAKWREGSSACAMQPMPGALDTAPAQFGIEGACSTQSVLEKARDLDTAIMGVGSADLAGTSGSFTRVCKNCGITAKTLRNFGIVGELCNRPFDGEGRDRFDDIAAAHPLLPEYTRAVPLNLLRELVDRGKRVVAIAGGSDKRQPIQVALASKYVSHLVTDTATAASLCERRIGGIEDD